tara:strand:+ start:112 stop:780 length:669 start_codon:yes stop_codon:yes gene_type:complete
MKLGVLFSGGKDSTMATYLAKEQGHEIACLITVFSKNKESYMFHTPSISKTHIQSEVMGIPLLTHKTHGRKEEELEDLEEAIKKAKDEFGIQGLVTGALHSEYQASRIKKICDNLDLECLNPLWHKNEFEYLEELIKNKFEIVIIGVSAYPLDESWLGRKIDNEFIQDVKELHKKYKIHPAGEGGEFETFVLNCPLFKKGLNVKSEKIFGEKNSWSMEIEVE